MQEMAGGDYIRTPVIFWGLDNLVFVGEIQTFGERQFSRRYVASMMNITRC